LKKGFTTEYFSHEGKIPVDKNWLQIQVKGEIMNCGITCRIGVEISSQPCESFDLSDLIIFFNFKSCFSLLISVWVDLQICDIDYKGLLLLSVFVLYLFCVGAFLLLILMLSAIDRM